MKIILEGTKSGSVLKHHRLPATSQVDLDHWVLDDRQWRRGVSQLPKLSPITSARYLASEGARLNQVRGLMHRTEFDQDKITLLLPEVG